MERTIEMPAVRREATIRAASFDEADNTVEIIWTTGARVRRNSWWDGPYDEELEVTPEAVRLERLNAGAPFLNTHDSYDLRSVLGSIVPGSAKIEKGRGTARVKLSRAADVADSVLKIREGDVRNVSVGYRVHKVIKTEGQDGDVPLNRVVDWEPLEISAVPIPADPGAQVRSEKPEGLRTYPAVVVTSDRRSSTTETGEPAMADKNNVRTGEPGGEGNTTEENRTAPAAPAAPAAPSAPAAVTADDVTRASGEAADRAVVAERKRVNDITDLARKAGVVDFGAEHIRSGTDVEKFRGLLLEKLMTDEHRTLPNDGARHLGVPGQAIDDSREQKRAAAMENALLHRSQPTVYKLDVEGARDFVGMSLLELARDHLEARGVRTRGMSKMDLAAAALQTTQTRAGLQSTSDFPIILGNVLNRTLRAGYEAAPQTFRPFTSETTVPDFKDVTRAQLGEAPAFDKVNEHGEFRRGSIGEAGEKYRIATYGKIVGITRQVIINDDLNAFTRIPRAFGIQAAQLESDVVWAQLLANPTMGDGVALFHANHGNLLTAGAIGKTTVSEARLKMGLQTGLDGKTVLSLVPQYLITSLTLQTAAEEFLAPLVPNQQSAVVSEALKKLTIIPEARLDNGIPRYKIAGDPNAYYFVAAPAMGVDLVELAYLEGARGVYTETRTGFDVDGVEIKVRLDVGAKVLDWRGLSKNPYAGS